MLLKRRSPKLSAQPTEASRSFSHLDPQALALLRWLNAHHVDYVLVGPVARAIRGERDTSGPVAIVPAPYVRNWERLSCALTAERATLRSQSTGRGQGTAPAAAAIKLTAEKLSAGRRWQLRCGEHELDLEGLPVRAGSEGSGSPGSGGSSGHGEGGEKDETPGYQELLYETSRFELAEGLNVEVASPEDLELYSHIRRTGSAPEFRVTRTSRTEHEPA
jgi:hypothetical protein